MRQDLRSVKAFLAQVRKCLAEGEWDGWKRPKNLHFLAEHGLRREDVRKEIEGLAPNHRNEGPMDDDSPGRAPGTVFVFLKPFETDKGMIRIYIKLKIPDDDPFCLVLSFHGEGCSK